MFKAALFDLDGTLTDSMNLSAQAFIHTLRKHLGREFTPQGIFAMFGPGEDVIFRRLDPAQAPAMMETFLAFYQREHNRYARLYPSIIPLLAWLRQQKIPAAIITGKGREAATITIQQFGLDQYFDWVITGSCVNRHKPHPEGILHVLDHFGVDRGNAFYLGDSPGDIQTARRAGVAALAALWGARDQQALLAKAPDAAFACPAEFHRWLKKMAPQ